MARKAQQGTARLASWPLATPLRGQAGLWSPENELSLLAGGGIECGSDGAALKKYSKESRIEMGRGAGS